ncbi:MAG: beta-agarase, partial [Planctomycetota bacterium]
MNHRFAIATSRAKSKPVLSLSILAILLTAGVDTHAQDNTNYSRPALSPEGEIRRDAHDFLFNDFIVDRTAKITGRVDENFDRRVLQELVVSQPNRMVETDAVIALPEGSQLIAGMFRHLALRGSGLLRIESISLLPFGANSHMHQSESRDDFFRVQMATVPLPAKDLPIASIEIHCSGPGQTLIETIEFHSQGRLSMKFDDLSYRNLGAERERVPVDVDIDPMTSLSISGSTDLHRSRWFRYYASPGGVPQELEQWAAERNFSPGRQIFKMQPSLVKGYSPLQPKLSESKTKPGHADLQFFEAYDSGGRLRRTLKPFQSMDYAMCFDEWPDFMSRYPGGRGTPKKENFPAAAELAAAFVKDQIQDGGRTASWWEVKNESTIKAEWDFHWTKDYDSWSLLADFHNQVAKQIHTISPKTKVGGPTSAWMQVQVNNFSLYEAQRDFMDQTRHDLDFYSHHFYEDFNTIGAWERRREKYTAYLLGRFEAILDMFRAHMEGTDNVKPILVTECGSLQPGRGSSDEWLRLRSYSAYLCKAMKRPDQIDLIVPFIFLNIPWSPASGGAAFEPLSLANGASPQVPGEPIAGHQRRMVSRFFDLWRDFDGERLACRIERDFVDCVAVHQDDTIFVAVTNMGGDRLSLNFGELWDSANVVSSSQRRLQYINGELRYTDAIPWRRDEGIPIDVEETTLIEFKLAKPIEPQNKAELSRHYASKTAVRSGDQAQSHFEIT